MTTTLDEKRAVIALAGRVIKADGPKGELTAVVNTSYLDRQGDVLQAGCWKKVVQEQQRPPVFWNHDYHSLPLGSVRDLQELKAGDPRIPVISGAKTNGSASALMARIHFALDTNAGRDAFVLASQGH